MIACARERRLVLMEAMWTRFLPATKSIPKEIMTLVDRPLIQYAIDEARDAGVERMIFVSHPSKSAIERHVMDDARLRAELRSLVFAFVPDGDGGRFYERDRLPEGSTTDDRRWRLKVGNSPLDPDALLMVGGGAVVGKIPSGLPSPKAPRLDMKIIPKLLAATIITSNISSNVIPCTRMILTIN